MQGAMKIRKRAQAARAHLARRRAIVAHPPRHGCEDHGHVVNITWKGPQIHRIVDRAFEHKRPLEAPGLFGEQLKLILSDRHIAETVAEVERRSPELLWQRTHPALHPRVSPVSKHRHLDEGGASDRVHIREFEQHKPYVDEEVLVTGFRGSWPQPVVVSPRSVLRGAVHAQVGRVRKTAHSTFMHESTANRAPPELSRRKQPHLRAEAGEVDPVRSLAVANVGPKLVHVRPREILLMHIQSGVELLDADRAVEVLVDAVTIK